MSAHFDRGVLLYKLKNYKQAEKELREELVCSPHSASAHAMLGMTLNVLRKADQAHLEARESARLSPSYAYAHYTLSYTFAQLNKLPEAEKAINEALRLNPKESYLFARASQLQGMKKNHQKALELADQGVACDPLDDGCLVQKATAELELGRVREADETLDAALSINAENQLAHVRKGAVQLRLGNKAAAFDHYREALRLKPDDTTARVGAVSALKSRNWLHYSLLMLTIKMRQMPAPVVVIFVILLLIPPLRLLVFAFLLAAAVIGQCHVFLLRFDKQFRPLLTKDEIHHNNFYVGLISLIIVASVLLWVFDAKHNPFLQPKNYPSYKSYLEKTIEENWYPNFEQDLTTVIQFYVDRDGEVTNIKVKKSSGNTACDDAAIKAVNAAAPFPPLPKKEAHPVPVDFTFGFHVHGPNDTTASLKTTAIP